MPRAQALLSLATVSFVAAMLVAACCSKPSCGCIKDPPCRPCENPCCLSPVQKVALEAKTHALNAPVAYLYNEKKVLLLTEKGKEAWDKDPGTFLETAIRAIKPGGTIYMDMNPGPDVDVVAMTQGAVPFQK